MKITKKIISIAASCAMITALSGGAISTTFAVNEMGTSEKDYTQAPYYYALMEWFDHFDYSEEQREQFMADTQVLDDILYDDNYWDYGNYSFCDVDYEDKNVGIETHSVFYPVTSYENGTYFSKSERGVHGRSACTHHFDPGCDFVGNCACINVGGSIQCYGFAKFLRQVYTGFYFSADSKIGGLSKENWTENNIKNYFSTKVGVGAHVRLHLKNKPAGHDHSYTIIQKSTTGIKIYDANWDNQCGIRITDVTWSQIYSNFDSIVYSNVYDC